MGRKKRPAANQGSQQNPGNGMNQMSKKSRNNNNSSEESYLVKKYRPDHPNRSIDAFVRYTKAHRMLDASFVRVNKGATSEKPYVFATRVNNSHVAWGRGKTRDSAIDCACRATFALVQAHGYEDFPMDEDCLTMEPVDIPIAPPPPPPPPPPIGFLPPVPGGPPLPPGLPPPTAAAAVGFPHHPPPHGFAVPGMGMPPPPADGFPPPPPLPPDAQLIPQPKQMSSELAVASSLSESAAGMSGGAHVGASSLGLSSSGTTSNASAPPGQAGPLSLSLDKSQQKKKKKPLVAKGGGVLVYDPTDEDDSGVEYSMEERRAMEPRYVLALQRSREKLLSSS
eukprot:CAMPEP_0178963116 /NCGR_PEP_ID=MMETSP0789-20121207/14816_1 /TAXON_ID=3005 /ORGANISM="Rhizosolenia setigera, Strain CCMP 1694" /LENGTH=337 /DNA_ID=CAMNT_0020647491 /DNA_START=89 /DNA_END=1102 /DNA_ORIENTATION=+